MKGSSNNYNGRLVNSGSSVLMILGGLLYTTAVSGVVLAGISVSADESVNTLAVTVGSSCTMTATGGNNGSFSANISPGTSSEIVGSTLTTVCNDAEGYSLYAIGYSGDSYDTPTNTQMIGTNGNISTGTSGSNSYWAMKLSSVIGITPPTILNSFDDYHVIPEDYTQIAKYTSNTASSTSEGAAVKTNYKVNISSSQTAGAYTGKVKYVMVHPNTADAPTTDISFDDAYASAGKTKLNGYYKMQDMSSSICGAVTLEDNASETTLIDSRDNKTYTVSKLRDGNCWMTQNLDHDIDSTKTYTSTDTDIPADWTPSLSTYQTGTTTWNNPVTAPESYDPGELYWNGLTGDSSSESACTAAGGTWDSVSYTCNFIASTGDSHHHLGNYYNWTSAVAMNDSSSYTNDNQDANQSICPAGWTLPKSGNSTTNNSFQYLITQYGWDSDSHTMQNPNIWNTPIKVALTGHWAGSLTYVGNDGIYWLPVANMIYFSYYFDATGEGSVSPSGIAGRYEGFSVRCLSR